MSHPESNYGPTIQSISEEMYDDCRTNSDVYDSPSGIKLKIGDADWAVTYWPASDENEESLSLLRDWRQLQEPVSYRVLQTGYVTKNDKIASRIPGGVSLDPTGEVLVVDINEVFTLAAIVKTAHRLKS